MWWMPQTDEPDDFVWRPGAVVCEFAASQDICLDWQYVKFDQRYSGGPPREHLLDRRRDLRRRIVLGWRLETRRATGSRSTRHGEGKPRDRQADDRRPANAHYPVGLGIARLRIARHRGLVGSAPLRINACGAFTKLVRIRATSLT